MTRPSTPPILSELRYASSPASQIHALQELKNELIGHEEKKEIWIGLGVVTPLVRILNSHKGNGKREHRDLNGNANQIRGKTRRTEEEEARLQAIIVVGSLAFGGPAFLSPLFAGHVVTPLLSILSPVESHPQVIIQALKTLNTIADSARLSAPSQGSRDTSLSALLYTQQQLSAISSLLLQDSSSLAVRQQVDLTASLIFKTCSAEHQRALLAQVGVLEALAVNIAPMVLTTFPFSDDNYEADRSQETLQPRLAFVLKAVGAIIKGSRLRAMQFLAAPPFTSAFASVDGEMEHSHENAQWRPSQNSPGNTRLGALRAFESLTPQLTSSYLRSSSVSHNNHSILGNSGSFSRPSQGAQSLSTAIEVIQSANLEYIGEEESPLIPWLLYVFRSQDSATSLTAAEILVTLNRLGLIRRPKESVFALLLIPPLVHMLDKDLRDFKELPYPSRHSVIAAEDDFTREAAPAILAMLTSNNVETQKAAVDAGAIKKLSQLLKKSFDSLPVKTSATLWAPDSDSNTTISTQDESCRLGDRGISSATYQVLRLRESVFAALGAIASEKDDYRKEIIDNGVIPFIIETLNTVPPDINSPSADERPRPRSSISPALLWHYRDAILAACGSAKALSRSVGTLRTSLMDAGLAAPLFDLLNSRDVELQVATTAVVCNLVLKFSPMREAIMERGILGILCKHAHSVNLKLRLNSLWALKHVIVGAPNTIKMACLEELGPGWLKQMLMNDTEPSSPLYGVRTGYREDGGTTPIRMNTPNAAGEQVDLLNAVVETSRERSQGLNDDGDEDLRMSDSVGGLSHGDDHESKFHGKPTFPASEGLDGSLSEHLAPHLSQRAMSDETAIQKEGLEIIRNLICGEQSTDMIDHVFRELGPEKYFDLLAAKLRPKILNAFHRDRRGPDTGVRHIQPPMEIVVSVCYNVVHIAAGQSRHRQQLVRHADLLRLIVPLFHHSAREVRACCAWIVINLTWVEDNSDKLNAKLRAQELARLGFFDKLEGMEKDESLDCRERGKTAREQMRTLLHA